MEKLAALLEKDLKLARGTKEGIVFLRGEMSTLNALLMTLSEMEEPIDVMHRELRGKVRELAYDMEDCLDISMHRLGVASKAAGLLRDLKTLGARRDITTMVTDLKARVAELGNRHQLMMQLPPDQPERSRAAVRVDPRIQALYEDAGNLQGIDGPRQKLVELLQDGAPQLKVVPVVGCGGIGKTTLAKQVYTAIQDEFDCTAFVSVSRNPDLAKILSDISGQVGCWSSSRLDDENQLIDMLRRHLENKRYLIVVDDIWTIDVWNTIKCCFVENNHGSRVITTTRVEDIAKSCCSSFHDYVYRMKPLSDLESRILFHRRVFHSKDACPDHLNFISNEILKKCGGLPLAILTVGSILASHQEVSSTEIWENIMNSFRLQLETSPASEWLRHVFNLGYNSLSLELKTCMLYLGIFPEDYEIVKDDVLRRWIAEGFVTEKHGSDLQEDIAESYFNELVNRNMIQIAEFDDCGEVLSCRLHGLMLDYIILKSAEENFVTIINDQHNTKGTMEVRRLSLHAKKPAISSKKKVRNSESNNVLGNMGLVQARSFNLWGPAEWLPCLKKFQLLRVLHLDIYGWKKDRKYDMSCIRNLFQLRYLRTSGFFCKKLLTQLCNLEHLKTLEVVSEEGYFVLDSRMLPSTLWHLILGDYVFLAGGIGGLKDLRTLCKFEINLQDVGRMKELGELTNLRELQLYQWRSGAGDNFDVLLSSLCRLSRLRSLMVQSSLGFKEDVLAHWSPPPRHLRRLHVLECLFSTVPADWIIQLKNLSSLEIEVRWLPSDGADVLASLTLLVHLRLHVEEHVPPEGVVVFHGAAFPNLREFWFRWEAPCLAFEAGTMPRLRRLVIDCYEKGTRQTDSVLDGIEHLGSLVEFKVHVYERERFISRKMECANANIPRVEEHRRWDRRSLDAALKEAISKHPGILRVVIQTE
ncbi:hypothetical protein U9M48_012714 [Paspalum notatum var. saurae]|uniref:AAA+ ATPase domain-containing protein n=1 Tax=Paspalum notatum var. saurae TaxID=547442 RepID=A0AAQ3WIW2_PASNO